MLNIYSSKYVLLLLQGVSDRSTAHSRSEPMEMASFAEATASVLLKHLDMVGISETNLEEVLCILLCVVVYCIMCTVYW